MVPNAIAMIGGKDAVLRVALKSTFTDPTDAKVTFHIDQAGAPTREFSESVTVTGSAIVSPLLR